MALTIESLENAKDSLPKALNEFSAKNTDVYLADARIEVFEGKSAAAIQGNIKGATEDWGLSTGIRCFAKKDNVIAGGFIGRSMGESELSNIELELEEMLGIAIKRARRNAGWKAKAINDAGFFGKGLRSTELADIEIAVDNWEIPYKKNPRDVSLEEVIKRVEDNSKAIQGTEGIASNTVAMVTGLGRKIFASTEGALIDQKKALTEAFIYVVAQGKAIETFYDTLGSWKGLEVLDGENEFEKNFEEFGKFLAEGTVELSNAPAMKKTENATVILDPWYNALLSHEITGHPNEADRALKKEAAWAGRAWWFSGIDDNKFGEQVASEELTVFSDPTIEGYGNYKYDDEGVKGKRIINIDKGILNEFLNSRETASILGKEPNGGMRATSAEDMPLVRMNNTCFAPGSWKKDEIFEDTKEGYYIVGQKIPSIGETRQNFKITCWKVYEIKNGELGQLYRSGGVTGDSYTVLKSIDAIADDFSIHNIPNCGKGTPMQTMKVGNGGPHIRAKATVSGSHMGE